MNDFDRRLRDALMSARDEGRKEFATDPYEAKQDVLRRVRRRRWLLPTAGSLAVAGAVAVAAIAFFSTPEQDKALEKPKIDVGIDANDPLASVDVGDDPQDLAFEPRHFLWTANVGEASLTRIDATSQRAVGSVKLGATPGDITVAGNLVAVALPDRDAVAIVDSARLGAEPREVQLPPGVSPENLAFSAEALWVVADDGSAHRVDLASGTPAPLEVAQAVDVTTGSGTAWILDRSGTIYRFDSATGVPGDAPFDSGVRDGDDVFYATESLWVFSSEGNEVARINTETGRRGRTAKLPGRVKDIAIDLDAEWVLFSGGKTDGLAFVEKRRGIIRGTPVVLPGRAHEIALTDDALWVTLSGGDRLVRYPKFP